MLDNPTFTLDGMRQLHSWTHASLTLVLDHLATLPAAAYETELPGFGSSSVRAQVMHIFNCEAFWIHTLRSLPYTDEDPTDWPTVSHVRDLQHRTMRQTLAYLSTLSERQLNSATKLHFPDGDTAVRTPALILHHVFTHAFHHKGQIVAMCRILGHPAPDTDLNQFE